MASTVLQIRNVPAGIHRRLKARAAIEGLSTSDFVLRELGRALERPTRQEVLAQLSAGPVRRMRRNAAQLIRGARDL